MARIRSVKPELRTSSIVRSWPVAVRYFWVLLWGYLDDYGRGRDLPKAIAGDCFPKDDEFTPELVDSWLNLMSKGLTVDGEGPICRYVVNGESFVHCPNWSEHQKPNRPTPSRLPPCPSHDKLTEGVTEVFTEALTDSPHGTSLPGAAEQWSSGAAQQQRPRSESLTEPRPSAAAAKIIRAKIDCTASEATAVAALVRAERKPRNLAGLINRMAEDGELPEWLDRVRRADAGQRTAATLAEARRGPECPHGVAGGANLHPTSHRPLCPKCRAEAAAA